MASAFGAGSGADMLQDILRRKLVEQAQIAQQRQFAANLAERARVADQTNTVAKGHLALGQQQLGENVRQFDANAPMRIASVGHMGAETDALNRAPAEAQKGREFTAGQSQLGRDFQGGQGDLNRQNAVRIAGINGANALRVAQNNHPAAGPTAQQQNEVSDSLALVDQILGDPALAKSVGPIDQYVGGVISGDPSGVNRFRALNDQLVGKLSLAQAGKLKGQGQISDKERAMLGAAATALRQGLSEQDYKAELGKIRSQFERMANPGATPALGAGHTIRARDPQGNLHEAPAGTALPAGWKMEGA